jgi:hypothetical protein
MGLYRIRSDDRWPNILSAQRKKLTTNRVLSVDRRQACKVRSGCVFARPIGQE